MYHVLKAIPFNMASMMVTYIGEATSKNRFSLSYGIVFTLFFRKLGISIPTNESVRELRHTNLYNEGTLYRVGYSKQEILWVKTHAYKQSTFTIHTDLPSSTEPATLIPDSSETLILVYNISQQSDSLPTQTNVQITSDHLQQITTSIINAFTP